MSKSDKPAAAELPSGVKELLSRAASDSVSNPHDESKSAAYRTAQLATSVLLMFEELFDFYLHAFPDRETSLEDEFEDHLSSTLPTALKDQAVNIALDVEDVGIDQFPAERNWPSYIILALAAKHGMDDEDIIYVSPSDLTCTESEIQEEFSREVIEILKPLSEKITTDLCQAFGITNPIPRILVLAISKSDLTPDQEISTWPSDVKTWLPDAYQSTLEEYFEAGDLNYCANGPVFMN